MNTNEEHLRLLSVFHYVVGGLAGLFACFPLIHLIMGVAMLTGSFENDGEGPPAFVGLMFLLIPAIIIPRKVMSKHTELNPTKIGRHHLIGRRGPE